MRSIQCIPYQLVPVQWDVPHTGPYLLHQTYDRQSLRPYDQEPIVPLLVSTCTISAPLSNSFSIHPLTPSSSPHEQNELRPVNDSVNVVSLHLLCVISGMGVAPSLQLSLSSSSLNCSERYSPGEAG